MNFFTFKWFFKFAASLIMMIPRMKKAEKLKKTGVIENYKPYVDKALQDWLTPVLKSAKVDFIVEGKENVPTDEPVIYAPNHQGLFDMPTLILNTPTTCGFVAKIELKKFPIVRTWLWLLDCVFIDRQNKRAARESIKETIELVKKGRSMVIFPEGTCGKVKVPLEFKGGVMMIAKETKAKIVPVAIEGTRQRFEETGNIVPGTVKITFLPPVETAGLSRDEMKEVPARLREMIVEVLKKDGYIQ